MEHSQRMEQIAFLRRIQKGRIGLIHLLLGLGDDRIHKDRHQPTAAVAFIQLISQCLQSLIRVADQGGGQHHSGNFLFFLGCGIPNAKPVRNPPGGTIIIRINRRAFQLGDPLGVFRQEAVDLQHFRRGFPQHQMETEVQLFYIQRLCVPLVQQLGESLQNNWGNLLRYTVGTGI